MSIMEVLQEAENNIWQGEVNRRNTIRYLVEAGIKLNSIDRSLTQDDRKWKKAANINKAT